MLHAVGEIYEDRGKNQKQKSLKSALTARDDAVHCIPWGKAASTDVFAGAERIACSFSPRLGQQPISTFSTKRVLTCPYMDDLNKRSK